MLARLFLFFTGIYLRLLGARRGERSQGAIRLVFWEIGPPEGEPWVLLHGLGSVAAGWGLVMRALRRDGCRVLAPELSALGGTRCPGEGLGVGPAVEVLAALMKERFRDRPATVAGLSLGGWIAVRLALAHPPLISHLILIDAAGYRDQDWATIESLVSIEDLAGVDRLYPALFGRVPWLLRSSRSGFLRAYTSPAVKNVLAGLTEEDTYDDADLSHLRMPVDLIWGERDGLFSLDTARAMARSLPGSRLLVLPGRGHALHLECPGELVAALRRLRLRSGREEVVHGES